MNIVSYFNPDTLERDNDGQLGLYTDETVNLGLQFFPIDSQEFDTWVNGHHGIKSFALHIDNGTATFSKEFRKSGDRIKPYWYAAKKVNGKLKKLYFGTDFTKEKLNQIVDRLSGQPVIQPVTQPVAQPVTELAGHGKSDYRDDEIKALKKEIQNKTYKINDLEREIQEYHREKLEQSGISLPPREETVLTLSGNFTKKQLDKAAKKPSLMELANDPVKLLTHKNKELERQNKDLNKKLIESQEKVDKRNQRIDTLEAQNKELNEIAKNNSKLTERLEMRIAALQKTLDERDSELFRTHEKLLKRDDTIAPVIAKYRNMTVGKTKKDNPRFAYLIDFLAEIDKLY